MQLRTKWQEARHEEAFKKESRATRGAAACAPSHYSFWAWSEPPPHNRREPFARKAKYLLLRPDGLIRRGSGLL